MKIIYINEMGHGRDSLHRLAYISKILKDNFQECEIIALLKSQKDEKLVPKRLVNKIEMSPFSLSNTGFGLNLKDALKPSFEDSKLKLGAKSWKELVSLHKPDFVIADNSPNAHLQCQLLEIPSIRVGSERYMLSDSEMHHFLGTSFSNHKSLIKMVTEPFKSDSSDHSPLFYFENDQEEDGGLKIDIFAYVRQNDPLKDTLISALDTLNSKQDASILVVMPGIEPINYRPNFELTPHFVRLQGALHHSPLCINGFSTGMVLESLKSGSPSWGVPFHVEQLKNRGLYESNLNHQASASSKEDVLPSLIKALQNRESNSQQIKHFWARSLKDTHIPFARTFLDFIRTEI